MCFFLPNQPLLCITTMTNPESRIPTDHLGLSREFQGTNGIARWTNGISKDVDDRPYPFYDTTDGT